MKFYLAGYGVLKKDLHTIPEAINLLESYVMFRQKDYEQWHKDYKLDNRKLFLDSGAFSAMTQGIKLNIKDYAEFVKKYEHMLEVYANMDVIGDVTATQKNQAYLESLGLKPLPTFHYKSDLKELERLCKTYKYIALGGLVPIKSEKLVLKAWLDKCFRVIIPHKTKVHGFGVGAFWLWKSYPWYSVDATTWLGGGKFRKIAQFNKTTGKLVHTSKTRSSNISPLNQFHLYTKDYIYLNRINIIEYTKAADYCTRLWEKRGFKYT